MTATRKIEIDETTAKTLEHLAAARGVTISELLSELLDRDGEPIEADKAEIAELDRRWARIEAGAKTIPHDDVVRWLDTWGTPAFRPWRDR
jgi:predicted transcriptional regulator